MRIERVVTAQGLGGNYCEDLRAIRAGGVRADGELLIGDPVTPGFRRVKEAGEALSVMLVLSDGQVAQGDCCSVVYAGYGGRDPVFRAAEGEAFVRERIAPMLVGLDPTRPRPLMERLEATHAQGPERAHTAIRYGVSQALLHAAALARAATIAEVVAEEYGLPLPDAPVPVLAQSGRERYASVDRMILKRVPAIPHGDFTSVAEIGADGGRLREYVRWMRTRVADAGADGYRPDFHLDVYGTVGDAFGGDPARVADFLVALGSDAAPHRLTVECPILASDRAGEIRSMAALVRELERRGSAVRIAADEHCNGLDDIRAFADARAAHMIQIKTPDLGSLSGAIEAVLLCHERGLLAFLGGSCNETDWASRVTVQVALATRADLIYDKPGFGVDEGYMIVHNEMQRALALIAARGPAAIAT